MRFRTILPLVLVLTVAVRSSAQIAPTNFRIKGKTVNAVTGQALAHAEISVAKAEQLDVTLQRTLTADDGAFSFAGLKPGKYVLVGQRNGFRKQGYEQHGLYVSAVAVGRGLISENLVFRLRPDAWIEGTIMDEESEPVPNATIYLFRTDASSGLRQTFVATQASADDRGHYRLAHLESGWYFIVVSAQPWFGSFAGQYAPGADLHPAERVLFDLVFPTTFYPGVVDSASASQIALNEGEGFTADFTLNAIPALRVRINHLNEDPAQQRSASLEQRIFGTEITPPSQVQNTVDDSVVLTGVPPGRYALNIQSYLPIISVQSKAVNITADMDLDANAAAGPPFIHGTIRMDGGLNLPPQASVQLWNSDAKQILDAQIAQNGEFSFAPDLLVPGNYSVSVMNGQYSIISKLSATGAKVIGQSLQINSQPIHLTIELCRTLSKINGTALRDGKPFAGAMIVGVPENPGTNLALFRRDQSDSDGTFTLPDVVPGRYKILAIENGWDLEWASPALLKTRLDRAESVDVQPNMSYQWVVNVE